MARSANGNGVVSHVVLQATGWVFRALQNSLNKGHSLALARQCSDLQNLRGSAFPFSRVIAECGAFVPLSTVSHPFCLD